MKFNPRIYPVIGFVLTVLFSSFALANESESEHHFHETSEDIVNGLTQGTNNHQPKTRSLFGGTDSRSLKRKKKVMVLQEDVQPGKYSQVEYSSNENQGTSNLKIQFAINSAEILAESYGLLDELAKALNDERLAHKKIIIAGHTDSSGDTHLNQHLSIKRAKSVRHYLQHKSHNHKLKLEVIGFGDTMPLVPNDSSSNRRLNRRVEIISE